MHGSLHLPSSQPQLPLLELYRVGLGEFFQGLWVGVHIPYGFQVVRLSFDVFISSGVSVFLIAVIFLLLPGLQWTDWILS